MIITFAQQKGGVGKTTLAIALANYLTLVKNKKVKVFDFDYQKSFYQKWIEDEVFDLPKLYDVETINEEQEEVLFEFQRMTDMKESEEYFIFDLAGTLDYRYVDLLTYSDFLVIPFEYSDISTKSTIWFISFLGNLESQSERIFIRSKYEKGYFYKNQADTDAVISQYGTLLETPVFKRNALQSINTRRLSYEQRYAIDAPFKELIACVEEKKELQLNEK